MSQETDVILLPTKWNKNKDGAWRMEIPVDIEDTYDDGGEDEINKSDPKVETREYESESGSMSVSSDQMLTKCYDTIQITRTINNINMSQ